MRALICTLAAAASLLATPALAYTLNDDLWDVDKGPVEYHPEPSGSEDVTDGSDLEAVREAFRIWSCVDGSRLRFREGEQPGVNRVSFDDGRNSIFWDENGTSGVDFTNPNNPDQPIPAVVIARGLDDQTIIRDAGDIILNGEDYTWSTDGTPGTLDVLTVMLPQVGVLLGLGISNEAGAVMSQQSTGLTELSQDDIDGVSALYPNDTESTCEGPYQTGQYCSCNDDCVSGLICDDGTSAEPICVPRCSGDNNTCPAGFACVLSARASEDIAALGRCAPFDDAIGRPPAASCNRTEDCAAGSCLAASAVGRSICRTSCDADGDCDDGYVCADGVCVAGGAGEGLACDTGEPDPGPEEPTCACVTTRGPGASGALLGVLFLGVFLRRRRR